MKKITVILVCLAMILFLNACNSNNTKKTTINDKISEYQNKVEYCRFFTNNTANCVLDSTVNTNIPCNKDLNPDEYYLCYAKTERNKALCENILTEKIKKECLDN